MILLKIQLRERERERERETLKTVIINGSPGSSWLFQRFNKFQLTVTDKTNLRTVLSS